MTEEQIKKEIEMKTLLQIPYDSMEYSIYSRPKTFKLENLTVSYNNGSIRLLNNTEQITDKHVNDFINQKIKDFFIIQGSWYDAKVLDKYKVILNISNKEIFNITYNNFIIKDSIIENIYNYYISNTNKNVTCTLLTEIVSTNEERREYYYTINKTPENYFKELFSTQVESSRLGDNKSRSRYYSPFPEKSFKRLIYNNLNKIEFLFCLEYLYGKKLSFSSTGKDMASVLANQPNTTFGIYDVQVFKTLTPKIQNKGPKYLKSVFEEAGIKPATDLKRWQKKYLS